MPLPNQPITVQSQLQKLSAATNLIKVDLKLMCKCKCVSIYGEQVMFWSFTCTQTCTKGWKGRSKLYWGALSPSLHELTMRSTLFSHTRTRTTDASFFILALVLPKIAEITGISVLTAFIYCRLKPLNNSAIAQLTDAHTCTHSRGPLLVGWVGPLTAD